MIECRYYLLLIVEASVSNIAFTVADKLCLKLTAGLLLPFSASIHVLSDWLATLTNAFILRLRGRPQTFFAFQQFLYNKHR
jgi:hypothetical protein